MMDALPDELITKIGYILLTSATTISDRLAVAKSLVRNQRISKRLREIWSDRFLWKVVIQQHVTTRELTTSPYSAKSYVDVHSRLNKLPIGGQLQSASRCGYEKIVEQLLKDICDYDQQNLFAGFTWAIRAGYSLTIDVYDAHMRTLGDANKGPLLMRVSSPKRMIPGYAFPTVIYERYTSLLLEAILQGNVELTSKLLHPRYSDDKIIEGAICVLGIPHMIIYVLPFYCDKDIEEQAFQMSHTHNDTDELPKEFIRRVFPKCYHVRDELLGMLRTAFLTWVTPKRAHQTFPWMFTPPPEGGDQDNEGEDDAQIYLPPIDANGNFDLNGIAIPIPAENRSYSNIVVPPVTFSEQEPSLPPVSPLLPVTPIPIVPPIVSPIVQNGLSTSSIISIIGGVTLALLVLSRFYR